MRAEKQARVRGWLRAHDKALRRCNTTGPLPCDSRTLGSSSMWYRTLMFHT